MLGILGIPSRTGTHHCRRIASNRFEDIFPRIVKKNLATTYHTFMENEEYA